jgi:hypothetical protein
MQSTSDIRFSYDETDAATSGADADLNTAVHADDASDTITFQAAWAAADEPSPGPVRHSVVLALESSTMERYAELDDAARMRVRAMLHDAVTRMVERLPDRNAACTLTVELTDEMLDAACCVQ